MDLFRVHAFTVEPRRTALDETEFEPAGGPIDITSALRQALDDAAELLERKKIEVDLEVDHDSRTSETRDLLLDYAFGNTQRPAASARRLAIRLANAMDARSAECLLVLAAYRDGDQRQVSLWTFPREEAFRFRHASRRPAIELLTDIFSRESRLRKGALFAGRRIPPDFVRGGALDFQAGSRVKLAADFWIVEFLAARLAVSSKAATLLLAGAIANTHASVTLPEERTQLFAGVIALKANPQKRWTMRSFAESFLDEHVRPLFLEHVTALGNMPLGQAFGLDPDVLERKLNIRAFELESGVLVSSPLGEVGESVHVDGDQLKVEGTIKSERMKARR